MTRYFLAHVSIEGFRGVNNEGDPLILRFKPDAVNSLHAPNGVGKSSIYEAIHFAINGTVPRLATLQDAEQGDSYIVNKFHSSQEATIKLGFTSDDGSPDVEIVVTRAVAGTRAITSPSGHPDPEKFLAALREDFVLVDYSRFAKLIDISALERGRSFSSLVGLSRYSLLRQALDAARRTQNINTDLGLTALDAEVRAAERSIAEIQRRTTAAHLEVTGKAGSVDDLPSMRNAVTCAIADISLLRPFVDGKTVMEIDFAAAEKAIEKEEGGEARKKLDNLMSSVASLTSAAVNDADLHGIDRLIELGVRRDEAVREVGAQALHGLLQRASVLLSSDDWHDPNTCPVCEVRGDEPIVPRLEARLTRYEAAVRLSDELCKEALSNAGIGKLRQLEEVPALGIAGADRHHIAFDISARKGEVSLADLSAIKVRLSELEKQRASTLTNAQTEASLLKTQLPPSLVQVTRTLSFAKQFRDAVNELSKTMPALAEKRVKLDAINRWKSFISQAAERFAQAEGSLANDRISQIQMSCQDLFGRLVRGGPDVKPTLIRAQQSEHVDLKLADFFGLRDLSARALLSESYRNAVAASIFLAAATKHTGVPRFMVLDDVTSSFDAGHQFALMDALRTKLRYGAAPDGLQFIILSHDTSLEKYFDRLNGTNEWHHLKLQGMSPKGRLMASAQEADRLKSHALQHLNAGQVDIGASFLRQYLEYKLGQIISKLAVPVPPDYATRGDKRTLSTYIDALTKAVDLHAAANRCVLTPQQISDLRNLHVPSIVGNFVSHYETGVGTPFNAYALLGVFQSIDDLADCFCYVDSTSNQKRFYRSLDRK